jgi:hypothetical protein
MPDGSSKRNDRNENENEKKAILDRTLPTPRNAMPCLEKNTITVGVIARKEMGRTTRKPTDKGNKGNKPGGQILLQRRRSDPVQRHRD